MWFLIGLAGLIIGIGLLAWAVLGFLGTARGPDPMSAGMTFHMEWLRGAFVVALSMWILDWVELPAAAIVMLGFYLSLFAVQPVLRTLAHRNRAGM